MNPETPFNSAGPRPPTPDRLSRYIGVPSVLLALLAMVTAITTTSCKQRQGPTQLPAPVVQVAEVRTTNVPFTLEFIGQLDSPQNVEVRARVEAFVDDVQFTEGTEVKVGDPLFLLDQKPFLEKLAAANGSLAEAKAGLNKYEKDVARLRPLAEKRAIPQQDLDNALASVEVGKANVQSAEARVESAKLDLGYCEVKAPVSGLIGAKEVSIGTLVGKGQSTLLATISQLDTMWFHCAVSEVDYLRMERRVQERGNRARDLPVTLILADGSEFSRPGRWVFLDRAADPATGTLRARAEFPNLWEGGNWLLRPGMFARARIILKIDRDFILVPQRAVQELQGRHLIWVVNPDSQAMQRLVKAGPRVGSDWVIEEGLKAGEQVIVEGVQKAREGAPVQPMTAEQVARAAAQAAAAPRSAKE